MFGQWPLIVRWTLASLRHLPKAVGKPTTETPGRDGHQRGDVINQVTTPETPWLLHQADGPLKAARLQKPRRSDALPSVKVESSADANPDGSRDGVEMFGNEPLLPRAAQGHQDQLRTGGCELLHFCERFFRGSLSERRADALDHGESPVEGLEICGRFGADLLGRTIECGANATSALCLGSNSAKEINSSRATSPRSARDSAKPGHRGAIGDHEVAGGEVSLKGEAFPSAGDEIEVRGSNACSLACNDPGDTPAGSSGQVAIENAQWPDQEMTHWLRAGAGCRKGDGQFG